MKQIITGILCITMVILSACTAKEADQTPKAETGAASSTQESAINKQLELLPSEETDPEEIGNTSDVSGSVVNGQTETEQQKSSEALPDPETEADLQREDTVSTGSPQEEVPDDPTPSQELAQPSDPNPAPASDPEPEPDSESTSDSESEPSPELMPDTEPVSESETISDLEMEPDVVSPSFDIDSWIAYAHNYGSQIGLIYDATATDCWDNPIIASSKSLYLERDIRSRLDLSAADGMQFFCVWAKPRNDGGYDLFIGYA